MDGKRAAAANRSFAAGTTMSQETGTANASASPSGSAPQPSPVAEPNSAAGDAPAPAASDGFDPTAHADDAVRRIPGNHRFQ